MPELDILILLKQWQFNRLTYFVGATPLRDSQTIENIFNQICKIQNKT